MYLSLFSHIFRELIVAILWHQMIMSQSIYKMKLKSNLLISFLSHPQNSGSSNTTWLFCVFKNEVNSAFQVGMRAYLKLYWLGRLSQHWTCLYFIVCANVVVAGIFNFIMHVIFTGFWNHSYKRLVSWNTQWTDFNRLNVIVNCLLKCYYAKAHDHAVVMYIIFLFFVSF